MINRNQTVASIKEALSKAMGFWLVLTTLVVILLWVSDANANVYVIELRLIDNAQLSNKTFTMGEISEFVSGNTDLWEMMKDESLGYSPGIAKSSTISKTTILGRLAERNYDWRLINLDGPETIVLWGSSQRITADELLVSLTNHVQRDLEVPVSFIADRPFEDIELPDGQIEVEIRYPDKPGTWLPEAIEMSIDGNLKRVISLSVHGVFSLPVVVSKAGIDRQTLINESHLGMELMELRPGREVVTRFSDAVGMVTNSRINKDDPIKLSRLGRPHDIVRGEEVILIIRTGNIEMQAKAKAMNNAFIGQRLTVERLDDNEKFTGLVETGPVVVVE